MVDDSDKPTTQPLYTGRHMAETSRTRTERARTLITLLVVGVIAVGCSGKKAREAARHDPMNAVRNPRLNEAQRADAIEELWIQVEAGRIDRRTAREDLKTLAWSQSWPTSLRVKALETLVGDNSPTGLPDSRRLVSLMLPREQNLEIIDVLSEAAAHNGWDEAVPALVRSLSRFDQGTVDAERPEYRAIQRLRPDATVQDTVTAIFVDPPPEKKGYGSGTPERLRQDAWDVLARLDRTGELRAGLILRSDASSDPAIAALRAALDDLHTLPRAGEELAWLWSLRSNKEARNAAWWAEAAQVIKPMYEDRARMLELRHAEPLRWASRVRPEWLRATGAELLRHLEDRLRGRELYRRTERDRDEPVRRQSLAEQGTLLDWGDLITLLVIDDAIHDEPVIAALFAQADMDRQDTSAEYGGLLEAWRDAAGSEEASTAIPRFRVVLYPPRPGQRRGDREFVASTDMIGQGDRAIAHYHFHAQQPRNGAYAGPSSPDLAYAARLGRTCLVFTSIAADVLNADLYQPDGVIIDLGELRRP
jgi:hypothetical protein